MTQVTWLEQDSGDEAMLATLSGHDSLARGTLSLTLTSFENEDGAHLPHGVDELTHLPCGVETSADMYGLDTSCASANGNTVVHAYIEDEHTEKQAYDENRNTEEHGNRELFASSSPSLSPSPSPSPLLPSVADNPANDLICDVSVLMDEGSTLLKQLDSETAGNIWESGRQSPIGRLVTGIADKQDGDLIAGVSELMDEGLTLLRQLDSQTADDICESGRQSPTGKLVMDMTDTQEKGNGTSTESTLELRSASTRSSSPPGETLNTGIASGLELEIGQEKEEEEGQENQEIQLEEQTTMVVLMASVLEGGEIREMAGPATAKEQEIDTEKEKSATARDVLIIDTELHSGAVAPVLGPKADANDVTDERQTRIVGGENVKFPPPQKKAKELDARLVGGENVRFPFQEKEAEECQTRNVRLKEDGQEQGEQGAWKLVPEANPAALIVALFKFNEITIHDGYTEADQVRTSDACM